MGSIGEGRVIAGYRLERLIGRGGMGAVWLASDPRLDRRVALKLLPEELASDPRFRQRFLAESQRAASLDHPNIVPIFDAGEADGELYIAMRYVEGASLDALIRDGPLDPSRALALLRGVADALDAAHAAGLVHRDVKPGNILVARTPSGEHAYLADFGLVKRLGDATLTGTGQIVGSVGYVAPEQIEDGPIDGRADVYSLGCTLYACLTGVAPFARESEMATLYAHVSAPAPRPSAVRPELAPLDPIIERGMAKDPGARFPSAGGLIAAATDALRSGTTRGFLFADLRGYTAFVDQNGDQAGAALLGRYRDLTRTVIAAHEGAEIRTEGDSFYVVFPSASRAVSAALALVEEATRDSISHTTVPISVGIGVHAGETAETAEGPVGSAVNTAARLCAAARPGEVLVSDTVRALVRTSLPVTFESRGRRSLKGLAEPVGLWRVRRDTAAAGRTAVAPRVRLGPLLRGGRGSFAALAAAGVIVIAIVAAAALGTAGRGGRSNPSPTAGSSTSGAGPAAQLSGAPIPSATAARAEWLAYTRRAAYVDGDLSCAAPDYAATSIVGEIRLARPDGSDDHPLAPGSNLFAHKPTWSPDGYSIVFHGGDETSEAIWSVRPDGTAPAPIVRSGDGDDSPTLPVISRTDPQRLAWVGNNGAIWIAGADGGATDGGAINDPSATHPRYSFQTGVVAADSDPTKPSGASIADLAWLPETSQESIDQRLGFVALDIGSVEPFHSDLVPGTLYSIRDDGTALAKAQGTADLKISQARWSPDGSHVALTVHRGAGTKVVIVATTFAADPTSTIVLDPGSSRDVAGASGDSSVIERDPAWSPDGTKIAFSSDVSGTYEIYTADASSGTPTQATHTESTRASCSPSWGSTRLVIPGPAPAPSFGAPLAITRGWLHGGTYTTAHFDPAFEVTVGEGWQDWQNDADDVWLRGLAKGTNVEVDIGRITVDYPDGCYGTPTSLAPTTAHGLVAWLQTRKKLKVGQPTTTQVGGAPAIQVDITGSSKATCAVGPNRILLFDVATGTDFVRPGETIRLIAVDVHGTLVVIMPRAYPVGGAGTFDAKLLDQLAQPIIDSIKFVGN